ncbi:short transient receptor potential channel 5-like [Exaiptasia diaphana]|uniref:Ion transport domain-containing protein n=1 Tax=Exaiptasia diaphana TaxID=2652724 RepID=A0A913X8W9_EXADI|nr:short transient receptor potential channel 5-like [Exaiptasia diaphana]
MFLTLRVFGHIMESSKNTGRIQIALFQIIGAVIAIFGQFVATLLAFSFAITKVYVVEISYKAMDNSTAHGFCENNEDGMPCWWRSLLHLVWSLLGIADLDPLKSSDGPSNILAQLLYGLFLIMAVVMMMNMMIALLSNTYQHVEV